MTQEGRADSLVLILPHTLHNAGMEFSISATHLSSTAITKVPFLKVGHRLLP